MTHAVFIVHLLNTEILCVKHPSPLPLHTQSTFPPDDPTAWRRWRWQPASTSWTSGPPTSQPRGRGQKARPGEEAEPQGISWPFRSCLPLQPCIPTESRLPAFQWTKNRGHEREVRKGGWDGRVSSRSFFLSDHSGDAHVLTELKSEVLTVLSQHFLLQSTVRFPSIHVSSKVSEKKVMCWPLWPSAYVFLPLLLTSKL